MPTIPMSYLTLKELTGKPSTIDEFHQRLRRFSRSGVVRLCCILNLLLAKWTGDYDFEAHARLIRSFFPPRLADAIISSNRLAFHRQQIFFVAQEALRYCDETARDVAGPYWGGIGVVFLMASDHLYSAPAPAASRAEELARTICEFIPIIEANGLQSFLMKMARSFLMTSEFLEPLRGTPGFLDFAALFQEAAGMPLNVYQALLFGALTRFSRPDALRVTTNPADFAVPENWFRSTAIPPEQITAFFNLVSGTADELADRVNQRRPRPNDFTLFRDRPLFREQGLAFPFDFSVLAEKFDSGPFWTVNGYLPDQQRSRLHSFWGAVFEAYINWLLAAATGDGTNRFYRNPTYVGRPNAQVCDGIIICARAAVFMEYKGATFTSESKYGNEPTLLAQEIDRKLVGTPDSRKGVRQLADAVQNICQNDNAELINGISLSRVDTVFPLIIMRDDIGAAFGMNSYLNLKFQELIRVKRSRRSVTPLFCLSADDIEKLSPYLADTSLSDLLAARYKKEKALLASFFTVDNALISKKGARRPSLLMEATQRLGNVTARILGVAPS